MNRPWQRLLPLIALGTVAVTSPSDHPASDVDPDVEYEGEVSTFIPDLLGGAGGSFNDVIQDHGGENVLNIEIESARRLILEATNDLPEDCPSCE